MKIIKMILVLLLTLPAFLQAQYMGGDGNGDASISLSNVHLPVHKVAVELPTKYELYQNYPNPFNPVTKIKFQISSDLSFQRKSLEPDLSGLESRRVSLIVYDITGREIQTLVNEALQPGTYEVTFNAYNLSSGVYFYKLEIEDPTWRTGNFSDTKIMIILK